MKITKLSARQILDSRGNPTVEATCWIGKRAFVAGVPSGASTGTHEAIELRDGSKAYGGKSVSKAIKNVGRLSKLVQGRDCKRQHHLDSLLILADKTENKSQIGANAMLGASLAICRAGAGDLPLYKHIQALSKTKRICLPVPFMNVINGGQHAGNDLSIQEFMLAPVGARTFSQAVQMGSEIYHNLKVLLKKKYGPSAINVGDEGGFAPPLKKSSDALKILMNAIDTCGYSRKVKIALDVAASEFYHKGKYTYEGKKLTREKMIANLHRLCTEYPIISLEDPLEQEDFEGFAELTLRLNKKTQVVGDDLLVTNLQRIRMGLHYKSCSALLLKVNQIGTVSEAIAAAQLARMYDWNVMVSHRSGETTDDFIADLAVGLGTGQIKAGAPCRGERVAKYNRLLQIEEELGRRAKYGA